MGTADQCQGAQEEEDFPDMNQPSFGLYQNLFLPISSLFHELTLTVPTSLSHTRSDASLPWHSYLLFLSAFFLLAFPLSIDPVLPHPPHRVKEGLCWWYPVVGFDGGRHLLREHPPPHPRLPSCPPQTRFKTPPLLRFCSSSGLAFRPFLPYINVLRRFYVVGRCRFVSLVEFVARYSCVSCIVLVWLLGGRWRRSCVRCCVICFFCFGGKSLWDLLFESHHRSLCLDENRCWIFVRLANGREEEMLKGNIDKLELLNLFLFTFHHKFLTKILC